MRKTLVALGILLVLVVSGVVWLRSGLRGPVPKVDPMVRWNAEHAQTSDNAAELYEAAFKGLVGNEDRAWSDGCTSATDPIPPEAVAWVAQNEESIELTRQASERSGCWFTLTRNPDGTLLLPHLEWMRTLTHVLRWRALIAVQQHDAVTVADSALLMDRMARHMDAGACFIVDALVGVVLHALAQESVTQPMRWPELSGAARAAYVEQLASVFEPPPSLANTLAGEQESLVWEHATAVAGSRWGALAIPPERVAGELERYFKLLRALASVPIERQCDPAEPLVVQLRAIENECPSRWNLPRLTADIVFSTMSRSLTIRARLISEQRGTRTVLELFLLRDRTGDFPDTLEPLTGDFKIDPFSGQPFVYRRTDDGFTLYSVGVDRQDDGGKHDPRLGEDRPGHDFVFWPIPVIEAESPATQP